MMSAKDLSRVRSRVDLRTFSVRILQDVALLLVLPNAAFVIFAVYFSLERPLINLDYFVCALVFLAKFRNVGVFLLLIAIFFDALFLIGQIMPVLRPMDAIYLIGHLGVAPTAYQFLSLIMLCVAFAIAYTFWRHGERRFHAATAVLANVLAVSYLATVLQPAEASDRIWRVENSRIIDSVVIEGVNLRSMDFVRSFSQEPSALMPSEYVGVTDDWLMNPESISDKAILILAESWGVSSDPEINEELLKPLKKVSLSENSISSGKIDFSGLTIEAELKELCSLRAPNFNLEGVEKGFHDCLPSLLETRGYHTVGVHGAVGLMYDRTFWYPRAGFDEVLFFEMEAWERRCYSFPGACDVEIMSKLPRYFSKEDKVFLYWLTLNSHAFYDPRDIQLDVFDCEKFKVPEASQTCRNLKLHAQFFYSLSNMLDTPVFQGAEVIIVGDHAPPILDREEKEKFFVLGVVPWVKFKVGG